MVLVPVLFLVHPGYYNTAYGIKAQSFISCLKCVRVLSFFDYTSNIVADKVDFCGLISVQFYIKRALKSNI